MQPICTHKIGAHSATPSHAYPVIRLPREFKGLIGKTANIYKTELGGEPAFAITVGDHVGKFCANLEQNQMTKRLNRLESEISELKSFLLSNEANSSNENRKSKAEGETRTCVVASAGPPCSTQR
jgi:hypothetical protein